jgi:hypothetical protein
MKDPPNRVVLRNLSFGSRYEGFPPIKDRQVLTLLRKFVPALS